MKFNKLGLLLLGTLLISSCTFTSDLDDSTNTSDTPVTSDYVMNITEEDVSAFKSNPVNIKFWNPITGPDAGNLQNLLKNWNTIYGDYITVTNDPLAENDHYTRIFTSFADNSTADLTLIHSSRVSTFQRADKLRDMSDMLNSVNIKKDQYLETIWDSTVINGKSYGLAWDMIPTVFFYNRNLIPEGYTEDMIHASDFTMADMLEMMSKAYVHNPVLGKRTYGMAFNYAYTENPFISLLYQLGGTPVDPNNPLKATFNSDLGVKAADALKNIPFQMDTTNKYNVASESGSNHLNIFAQGRALFTIDGLWSTNSLVYSDDKVDTGIALLPLVEEGGTRNTFGDSHVFATFKNNSVSQHKDNAIALVIKYLVDNSLYWCEGGKVAVRNQDINDTEYQELPWAFISKQLEVVDFPQKVYTFNTMTSPTGEYISKLCEGTLTDTKAALDECAKEAEELARGL